MQNILTAAQIKSIRVCGRILQDALLEVIRSAKAGISTKELDTIAENQIRKQGATPSFKGYEVKGIGKFPSSLCVSINNEIVHGIPVTDKILKEGDVVSFDLGAEYEGICTDMAATVGIGTISNRSKLLIDTTKASLAAGIEAIEPGARIGAIGAAVQSVAEKQGFGVVRDFVGHGIGALPHLEPNIPNFGTEEEGPMIEEGMALAIEPMITEGGYKTKTSDNRWTVMTEDGSVAAHFEHTIIIVNGKPEIVTK